MTLRINDILTALDDLVPGEHAASEADVISMKTRAAGMAVSRYSKDRPRRLVADVDGVTDAESYSLADLASWADGFSSVTKVEYPIGTPLNSQDWSVYEGTSEQFLSFEYDEPEDDEQFRVHYTGMHIATSETGTITAPDDEAVIRMAASHFCEALAALYALNTDSTIMSDSVDHRSQADYFLRLARQHGSAYERHMGLAKDSPLSAAVGVKDFDPRGSDNRHRLTHRERWR